MPFLLYSMELLNETLQQMRIASLNNVLTEDLEHHMKHIHTYHTHTYMHQHNAHAHISNKRV